MKNITHLFLELVQIDSPSGQEEKVTLFLQRWLKTQGFSVKKDAVGNLYAKNKISGPSLLLCAHMDTVDPGKGIKPKMMDGVIKSDGTTVLGADNKAALAAIMVAVEKAKNKKPLELLFTVKEETGGGVEYLPFSWIASNIALIFDSSQPLGGIVLRSPFITNFTAVITGKAAHASLPGKGLNAFTPAFAALTKIGVGSLDGGETTVNVGKIEGGIGVNTIPPSVTVKGEVRSYDKSLFDKRVTSIKNIFTTETKNSGAKLDFSTDGYCPGYVHEKNGPVIACLEKVMKTAGLQSKFYKYSGVSDANILNAKGIKTINLADGTKFSHTAREEIKVADLEKLADIAYACIMNL